MPVPRFQSLPLLISFQRAKALNKFAPPHISRPEARISRGQGFLKRDVTEASLCVCLSFVLLIAVYALPPLLRHRDLHSKPRADLPREFKLLTTI